MLSFLNDCTEWCTYFSRIVHVFGIRNSFSKTRLNHNLQGDSIVCERMKCIRGWVLRFAFSSLFSIPKVSMDSSDHNVCSFEWVIGKRTFLKYSYLLSLSLFKRSVVSRDCLNKGRMKSLIDFCIKYYNKFKFGFLC